MSEPVDQFESASQGDEKSTGSVAVAPSPAPPARKPHRRRWFLRIAIVLVVLLAVVFIVGEIIFTTALPRDIVVSAVQKQLGLRMSAKSVSTGWFGHTTLHEVTLTLPLAEKAFVTVPTLEVHHAWLPWLAITGDLSLHRVVIDKPTVYVFQDSSGRWNLQDVAELLARAAGSKNASKKPASSDEIPPLPSIAINDATIIVIDQSHRKTTLSPISVTGEPNGPLIWQYDVWSPDRLKLTGRVAPGGIWSHDVQVKLANVGDWVRPWAPNWPQNASFDANWTGQATATGASGWLNITDARFADISAHGPVQIDLASSTVSIKPRGVQMQLPTALVPLVTANGGSLSADAFSIQTHDLAVTVAGGNAKLNAKYSLADGTASARGDWQNLVLGSTTQSGDFSGQYSLLYPGQPRVTALLHSHGALKAGTWQATINLNADSTSANAINWTIAASDLQLTGRNNRHVNLSGISLAAQTTGSDALLTSATLAHGVPIEASAGYTASKKLWWASADGRDLAIPKYKNVLIDFDLNAWGNADRAHLALLYGRTNGLSVSASGEDVFDRPNPVQAEISIDESPTLRTSERPTFVRGTLHSAFTMGGTLQPLQLDFTGNTTGTDVGIGSRDIGDLAAAVSGSVESDPDVGEHIFLHSEHVNLFGGQWHIRGQWPVKNSLLNVSVGVDGLDLAKALSRKDISGTADADFNIDVRGFSLRQIQVKNIKPVVAKHISVTGAAGAPVAAVDEVRIEKIRVRDGVVKIDPIIAKRHEENIDGSARLSLHTTLENPLQIHLDLSAASWPYHIAKIKTAIAGWADGSLDANLQNQSAVGNLKVRGDVFYNEQALAHATADLVLAGHVAKIDAIKIETLGGNVLGDAVVDLDHRAQSHVALDWLGLDSAKLAAFVPQAKDLTGTQSGSFRLGPTSEPRSLAPMSFTLVDAPTFGRVHGVAYGDLKIFGYFNPDNYRVVLDDVDKRTSSLAVLGGKVNIWGRVTQHGDSHDRLTQSLVQLKFINLSLNELFLAGDPKAKYTPGRIDGEFTVVLPPGHLDWAFGNGMVTLSNSDLAAWGPIALLYNLMSVGHDTSKPRGRGSVAMALENGDLAITAMRYFDRGIEVRASGTVGNAFAFPDSTLNFTAVGSARPFSAIGDSLPGLGDIDSALSALQQDTVSVQIGGTIKNYTYKAIPFADLTQSMQQFLVGDVRPDSKGAAQGK